MFDPLPTADASNRSAAGHPLRIILGAAAVILVVAVGITVVTVLGRHNDTTTTASKPSPVAASPTAGTFILNGQLLLHDPEITGTGDWADPSCTSMGEFDDIQEGAQVVVTDQAGATIAAGQLNAGTVTENAGECLFSFTIFDVPAGHASYGVQVSNRSVVQFSEAEARSGVKINLGN